MTRCRSHNFWNIIFEIFWDRCGVGIFNCAYHLNLKTSYHIPEMGFTHSYSIKLYYYNFSIDYITPSYWVFHLDENILCNERLNLYNFFGSVQNLENKKLWSSTIKRQNLKSFILSENMTPFERSLFILWSWKWWTQQIYFCVYIC